MHAYSNQYEYNKKFVCIYALRIIAQAAQHFLRGIDYISLGYIAIAKTHIV